jgi:hypothetical protein
MECSIDNQDRPSFKLSEPVFGHIVWLLEEVQKPDSDSRSEERVIKKNRSLSNLAEK